MSRSGGEPPVMLSRRDRRGSVLGYCVTAVPAKRPLRAGHAGGVLRSTHVASYHLYERFQPDLPAGKKGWGAKGDLDRGRIGRLAKGRG